MTPGRRARTPAHPPRTIYAIWLTSLLVGAGAIGIGFQHSAPAGVSPRGFATLLAAATGRGAHAVTVTAAYGSALDGHWHMIATVEWASGDGSRHAATILLPTASQATATSTALPVTATEPGEPLATVIRQLDSVGRAVTPVAVFDIDGSAKTFLACAGESTAARCTSIAATGRSTHRTATLHVVSDLGADAVQVAALR